MKIFRVVLMFFVLIMVIVTIFDVRDMIVNDDHSSVSGYFAFALFVLLMLYQALQKKVSKNKPSL